jgi:hypothetical protein
MAMTMVMTMREIELGATIETVENVLKSCAIQSDQLMISINLLRMWPHQQLSSIVRCPLSVVHRPLSIVRCPRPT